MSNAAMSWPAEDWSKAIGLRAWSAKFIREAGGREAAPAELLSDCLLGSDERQQDQEGWAHAIAAQMNASPYPL
jgi:hypothetical protein